MKIDQYLSKVITVRVGIFVCDITVQMSASLVVVATRFLEYSVNQCTRLFLKPSYSVLLNSVSKRFTQFYFYQEIQEIL